MKLPGRATGCRALGAGAAADETATGGAAAGGAAAGGGTVAQLAMLAAPSTSAMCRIIFIVTPEVIKSARRRRRKPDRSVAGKLLARYRMLKARAQLREFRKSRSLRVQTRSRAPARRSPTATDLRSCARVRRHAYGASSLDPARRPA